VDQKLINAILALDANKQADALEAAARALADAELTGKIAANAAVSGELRAALDAEIADRITGDAAEATARTTAITSEAAARTAAINQEATARAAAINQEAAIRLAADEADGDLYATKKENQLTAIMANDALIQAAQLDIDMTKLSTKLYSFTERMNTAIGAQQTQIDANKADITTNTGDITTNTADIISNGNDDITRHVQINTLVTTFGKLTYSGSCPTEKTVDTSEDCQMLARTNIAIGVFDTYTENQYTGVSPIHATGMNFDSYCEDGWNNLHVGGAQFNRYGSVWDEFCDWATVTIHPYPTGCFRIGTSAGIYYNAGGSSNRECSEDYPCICKQ